MARVLALLFVVAGCVGQVDPVQEDEADSGPSDPGTDAAPVPDELEVAMWSVVGSSLPALDQNAAAWIADQNCTSCHAVPVMLWSHSQARDRGLSVDQAALADRTTWAIDETTMAKKQDGSESNLDGAYQLILGRDSTVPAASYEQLALKVERGQVADGSWPAGGQLPTQRRSEIEIDVSSTMTAILALDAMGRTGAAIDSGLANIEPWMTEGAAVDSVEALLLRMLIENRFRSPADYQATLTELLARQNTDGGWGWLDGEDSNALATGQVLYALARSGYTDPEAIRAAWTFLRDTQQPDGSWVVPSTKQGIDGPLYTAVQWGAGWAAIGILDTLPGQAPGT